MRVVGKPPKITCDLCRGDNVRQIIQVLDSLYRTGTICWHLLTNADILGKAGMMNSRLEKRTLDIALKHGILRPKDLDKYGIPRKYLNILFHKGKLERIARGLYVSPEVEPTENRTLVEVIKRVPNGVICLLSALLFHDLTTQVPHEVWIAIDRKQRLPKKSGLPMRIFRFSGDALRKGIEKHIIEGVVIKVYNPAKTVADCFKYRNKIGLDVAIEALRDCKRGKKATNDQLWQYAKICRVMNIVRPYLEAII